MPARKKTLLELVEDNTFLGRKDWELLDSDDEPPLPWKTLEKIRQQFRDAGNEFDRRRYRIEFEKAIPKLLERRARSGKPLEEALAQLGPAGSAEQLLAFFPAYLRWDDGKPFRLDPYQRLIIELGWRRDEKDRRIFKEIGTGIPRGNGKTPFWSGIATHSLLASPGKPKVLQASGAGDQAKLGIEYVEGWIGEDERLRRWLRSTSSSVRRRDGRGDYSVMKASGSLGHGRKPSRFLVDEFWTIETAIQEKTVTAGETAIFKLPDAFWAWISTAGYSKDTMLGRAYDSALKLPHVETHNDGFHIRAWDEESGRLFLWWGVPDGYELDLENDRAMLKVIKAANPASWIDHRELLRALKRAMSKGEFEVNEWIRFNLNGWTKTKAGWLPAGCVRRLRVDEPSKPGIDAWVAVDAASVYDTTGVVWATRLPNGRILLEGRAWAAREDAPAHVYVPGGRIDNRLAADFIRNELAVRYRVREVVGDPRFFDVFLWELAEAGLLTAPFQQNSGDMRDAEQHFYDDATAGKIAWHDPTGIFARHLEATASQRTSAGIKVVNPEKRNPIDLTTAGIMARERCALSDRRDVSVYEKRGLEVLGTGRRAKEPVGAGETGRSSQALPYSPELAQLLGLGARDDELDDVDDLEDDE
jgi:phage terminase large subunit-like protein